MWTPALALHHHTGSQSKVHLGFRAGFHLDAHKGWGLRGSQGTNKAFHRLIAASKPALTDQILVNKLGRKPHCHRGLYLLLPGQARTLATRAEGRNGWF